MFVLVGKSLNLVTESMTSRPRLSIFSIPAIVLQFVGSAPFIRYTTLRSKQMAVR